jgi:hypothetical protein
VEFTLIKSTNSNHEFHAINVTGICGPMCRSPSVDRSSAFRTLLPTNFSGGERKRGRGRGSGGGGEGGAKYERPVLQERTYDEPADGFSRWCL